MDIEIKTEEEIKIMREGGRILAHVLDQTCRFARPGISTLELDQFAEKMIREKGGAPSFKGFHGYPATICACPNEVIVHGIPNEKDIIKEGDLLTIDCGVLYKGFHTDAARSIGIGKIDPLKERLIKTAYYALDEVTNLLKPGIHLNEIGKTIEKIVKGAGFHIIYDLTGHGIGRKLHEDPIILNYWEGNPGPILKAGMTLAIEPIFTATTDKMDTLPDHWTLISHDRSPAVQVENTFLLTDEGCEAITKIS